MALSTTQKIDLTATDPNFSMSVTAMPEPEDKHLYYSLGTDYEKYLEMRRDGRIRSLLRKRRQSLLGRNMVVAYPDEALEPNEDGIKIASNLLNSIKYESLCSMLLNTGQLIGFAVARMDLPTVGDQIVPTFRFVPQRRWAFVYPNESETIYTVNDEELAEDEILTSQDSELRLLTRRSPVRGERVPKSRFILYTFDGDGSPWGLGLGYSLYPWYVIKREASKSWLLHSDRIGSPPTIGNHPIEISERTPEGNALLTKFEGFLRSVSPNGWARLPAGFEAKVVEALGGMGPETHARLIELADQQMSLIVLDEVQYSDKVTGSYAANSSQVDDREASLIDADANLLDEQLDEQFWALMEELNFPQNVPRPKVRRETVADIRKREQERVKAEARSTQATSDQQLMAMGLRPTEEYIKQTYGEQWSFVQQPGLNPLSLPPTLEGNVAAPATPAVSLDDVAGLFQEAAEFAAPKPKQKQCKKGVSCGGSCISANKVCRKSLSSTQKQRLAQLTKAARSAPPATTKPKAAAPATTKPDDSTEKVGLDELKNRAARGEASTGELLAQAAREGVADDLRNWLTSAGADEVKRRRGDAPQAEDAKPSGGDAGRQDELGDAARFNQGPKINDQEAFDREAEQIYDLIDQHQATDGLVPIVAIRRALGDRVTEPDFNRFITDLQQKGYTLIGGDPAANRFYGSSELTTEGITTALGGRRFYIKRDS